MFQLIREFYKGGKLFGGPTVVKEIDAKGYFYKLRELAKVDNRFKMGFWDNEKFYVYRKPYLEGFYTKYYLKRI